MGKYRLIIIKIRGSYKWNYGRTINLVDEVGLPIWKSKKGVV